MSAFRNFDGIRRGACAERGRLSVRSTNVAGGAAAGDENANAAVQARVAQLAALPNGLPVGPLKLESGESLCLRWNGFLLPLPSMYECCHLESWTNTSMWAAIWLGVQIMPMFPVEYVHRNRILENRSQQSWPSFWVRMVRDDTTFA